MSPFCREHWTNNLDATFSTGSTFNPDIDFRSSHALESETCIEKEGKKTQLFVQKTFCMNDIIQKQYTSTIVGTDSIFGIGWRASTDRNASVLNSYLFIWGTYQKQILH